MRLSHLDIGFFIFGLLIAMYLFIVAKAEIALYPAIILIAAAAGIEFIPGVETEEVEEVDEKYMTTIIVYTAIALVGIFIASLSSPLLFKSGSIYSAISSLPPNTIMLFGVLMAISEEFFFRGFVTSYLLRLGNVMAIVTSAMVFTIYHLAVYGTQPSSLAYVFIAGLVLNFVFVKTGLITPTIIAHVINNILAVV
jgi:membrane protease YdiL (CAAX protease family)